MILEKCKRLSLEERTVIETLLKEKRSKSYIAKKLCRARSTPTREVNKWIQKPTDAIVTIFVTNFLRPLFC